jgi:hypothetical protein
MTLSTERPVASPPARIMAVWERMITPLDAAEQLGRKYFALPEWGRPIAASTWCDEDGRLRASAIEYANGRRLETRHQRSGKFEAKFTRIPA